MDIFTILTLLIHKHDIPFHLLVLQILTVIFYGFQFVDLLFLSSNLFLSILLFLILLSVGLFSLYLFQIIPCWCIEHQLIFVCWFYIPKLYYISLLGANFFLLRYLELSIYKTTLNFFMFHCIAKISFIDSRVFLELYFFFFFNRFLFNCWSLLRYGDWSLLLHHIDDIPQNDQFYCLILLFPFLFHFSIWIAVFTFGFFNTYIGSRKYICNS